ncbi:hypothetical protein B296_00035706, partial [Ensete ventricosum]
VSTVAIGVARDVGDQCHPIYVAAGQRLSSATDEEVEGSGGQRLGAEGNNRRSRICAGGQWQGGSRLWPTRVATMADDGCGCDSIQEELMTVEAEDVDAEEDLHQRGEAVELLLQLLTWLPTSEL